MGLADSTSTQFQSLQAGLNLTESLEALKARLLEISLGLTQKVMNLRHFS